MSDTQDPKPASNPLLIPVAIVALAIVAAAFIMRPQPPTYVPAPAKDINVRIRPSPPMPVNPGQQLLDDAYKPTPYGTAR